MKQPHLPLTFGRPPGPRLLAWKKYWKKLVGSLHSTFPNIEKLKPLASANPVRYCFNRESPCYLYIKSTVDIQPTVRLVPKPFLLCSSGDVLHLIHHPRQHSWQSSSDLVTPRTSGCNLQNTVLIYSKKVFWCSCVISMRWHLAFLSINIEWYWREVEGNNRHKRVVLVRQCAIGDLSWSFHDLLQFQRQMCFHVNGVHINLAFHVLWSFTSNLLSSSAPSAPVILVEFPSKFRINKRWTSNSPRICAILWARIRFDHCPNHPGGNMHRNWQMSTWRLEWWWRKGKCLSCPFGSVDTGLSSRTVEFIRGRVSTKQPTNCHTICSMDLHGILRRGSRSQPPACQRGLGVETTMKIAVDRKQ